MKDPRGVIEILNVLTGIENINEEDNLVNDLGIDSLNMVELMLSIEVHVRLQDRRVYPLLLFRGAAHNKRQILALR